MCLLLTTTLFQIFVQIFEIQLKKCLEDQKVHGIIWPFRFRAPGLSRPANKIVIVDCDTDKAGVSETEMIGHRQCAKINFKRYLDEYSRIMMTLILCIMINTTSTQYNKYTCE